jgi:PAS domain S-box-containing protein
MWSAIFADHELWHTIGENTVWIAGAFIAIGVIWKNNLIGRPIKWVWQRLVSEPVSHWSRDLIGTVVEDKIVNSTTIQNQEKFQKRVDDSIHMQQDFRHEIKREVTKITQAQAVTASELGNIHSCLDRRFTETQAQIDRMIVESSGNRDRIRQMYDIQDAIVFETDGSGNFTYFNPAFSVVTGLSIEDALGSGWSHVIHPEDQARVFKSWADAHREDRPFTETFRLQNVLGSTNVRVKAGASPLKDASGKSVGWVGAATLLSPPELGATLEPVTLTLDSGGPHG